MGPHKLTTVTLHSLNHLWHMASKENSKAIKKTQGRQAQNETKVTSAKHEKAVEDLDNEKKLSWKLEQQILENCAELDHKQEFLLAKLNFMKKQPNYHMHDMQLNAKLLQPSQSRIIKSNEETALANERLQESQAEAEQALALARSKVWLEGRGSLDPSVLGLRRYLWEN